MTDKVFEIIKQTRLSADIFRMTLRTDKLPEIRAGQFLNLEIPNRPDLLMRRPFGINGFDTAADTVDILYRVRGKGTEVLSALKEGTEVNVFLPLGNGFTLAPEHKKVVIVAGGMGIAPLLPLPQTYAGREYYSFLGFKTKADAVMTDAFRAFSKETFVNIDEDGGGFITDVLKRELDRIKPDVILSCGPEALFSALKKIDTGKTPVFVSLEERMACGLGACLVCACEISENGEKHKKRVCKDGPVFLLSEVVLW